jgi:hypothetical protein
MIKIRARVWVRVRVRVIVRIMTRVRVSFMAWTIPNFRAWSSARAGDMISNWVMFRVMVKSSSSAWFIITLWLG